jgi:hypothetical protein
MTTTSAVSYTLARAIAAEGARIGIVTCLECGTAILIDPDDAVDPLKLHDAWHELPELSDDG